MHRFWTRSTVIWLCILSAAILPMSGCVYLVVGSLGALGGYVASPDTVEGTVVDREYDAVWRAAEEVLSTMGMLEARSENAGMLEARLQGVQVKVTVLSLGPRSVKIAVKARKNFFPKVKTAQEVYIKIVTALDVKGWEDDY